MLTSPASDGRALWWVPVIVTAILIGLFLLSLRDGDGGRTTDVDSARRNAGTVESVDDSGREPSSLEGTTPVEIPTAGTIPAYRGIVVGAFTGDPIADATLTILDRAPTGDRTVRETRSGADGRFSFADGSGASAATRLRVSHPDFVGREYPSAAGLPDRVELFPGVQVTGEVQTPEGAPITGGGELLLLEPLEVSASGHRSDLPRRSGRLYRAEHHRPVPLGEAGRFRTTVGSAEIAFQAWTAQYGPGCSELVIVDPERPPHVIVRLGQTFTLRGRVSRADETPIAGATVVVYGVAEDREPDRNFGWYNVPRTARTDAAGSFEIEGLPSMATRIAVTQEQHTPFFLSEPIRTTERLEVVLEPGSWLEGTLTSTDGRAIPTGSFVLQPGGVSFNVAADGRFRSAVLGGNWTDLHVVIPGFRPHPLSWRPSAGAIELGTVALDPGRSATVQVLDEVGAAVAGAQVSWGSVPTEWGGWIHGSEVLSDEAGRATLSGGMTEGSVQIRARKSGYSESTLLALAQELADPQPVVLERTGRVQGQVVDVEGRSVFGVRADAQISVDSSGRMFRNSRAFTTPSGQFILDGIATTVPFEIRFDRSGYPPATRSVEALSPGETRDLGVIPLSGGRTLTGRVEDEEQRAVPGASVQVATNRGFGRSRWADCDRDGRFVLDGLGDGPIRVQAVADGYLDSAWQTLSLSEDSPSDITLQVDRCHRFEGQVVDERGRPVEGASVTLLSSHRRSWSVNESAMSDADGRFTVDRVPARNIRVNVHHNDFRDHEANVATLEQLDPTIVLVSGAGLIVHLSMADGDAIPERVQIALHTERSQRSSSSEPANGAVRLGGLDAGRFKLTVSAQNHPATDPVEVELEDGTTVEVTVAIPAATDPVLIRVVGPEGAPVPQATLQFADVRDRGWRGFGSGSTDAEGIYRSRFPLGPDTAIQVQAAALAPALIKEVRALVRDGEVTLQLEPASGLGVTVREATSQPAEGVSIEIEATENRFPFLWGQPRPAVDGHARFDDLAAGKYRVTVQRDRTQLVRQEIEIGRGETRELTIDLPPTISVTGVVRVDGRPVQGGELSIRSSGANVRIVVGTAGRFEAELPGAGRYDFRYSRERNRMPSRFIEVEDGAEVELAFDQRAVRGLVLDADGTPLAGISGRIRGPNGYDFATDATGRFSLDDVLVGTYSWSFGDLPPDRVAPTAPFEVTEDREVTYRLLAARTIALQLVASEGEVPERVSVYHLDGTERNGLPRAKAAGSYAWPLDGQLGLLRVSGFAPVVFEVGPDQETVPVALERGSRLRVRLETSAGPLGEHSFRVEPSEGTELNEHLRDYTTWSSGERRLTLPVGRFRILATLEDGRTITSEVETNAETETEVTVR